MKIHFDQHYIGVRPPCRERFRRAVSLLPALLLFLITASSSLAQWTGNWAYIQGIPVPRTGHCIANSNGYVYVLGGRSGSTNLNLAHASYHWPAQAPASNWFAIAPMNTTRYFAAAAGAPSGKIYVFGGYVNGAIGNTVEEYDPQTNTWTTKASMPGPRARHKAVTAGGLIYVLGGINQFSAATNTMYIYNPGTNTWTVGPSMPAARLDFGATMYKPTYVLRNLVVAGGRPSTAGTGTTTVWTFDIGTNSWSTAPQPLPVAVYGNQMASDTTSSHFYSTGGIDNAGFYTPAVWLNFPNFLGPWQTRPALPMPIADHQIFASETFDFSADLFLVGGTTTGNVPVTEYSHTWIWIALPAEDIALAATVQGNEVLLNWQHDPTGVSFYELQRSTDGLHFLPIWNSGGSGQGLAHSAIDPAPLAGTHQYRIRIQRENGDQQISSTVSVNFVRHGITARLVPTNSQGTFDLHYQLPSNETSGSLRLFDLQGRIQLEAALSETEGKIALDLASNAAGIYFVHVATATESKTLKIFVP